jgi:hypothetical protein
MLRLQRVVFDFNSDVGYSHFQPATAGKEMGYARRTIHLCTVDGFSSEVRIQQMRSALPGQLSQSRFLVLRSILLHGVLRAGIAPFGPGQERTAR